MSSIPEPVKKPKITVNLTVSFDGKENMSLSDMAEISTKIDGLVCEAKKLGKVDGNVAIGKQKYKLEG